MISKMQKRAKIGNAHNLSEEGKGLNLDLMCAGELTTKKLK